MRANKVHPYQIPNLVVLPAGRRNSEKMMGIKILAALAALSFVLSPPATAQTPFKGSTVFVPPLFEKNAGALPPPRIMRMPISAGVVSRVVTTRLPNSPGLALIVKGHKYYSLCTPKQYRVACSPLAGLDSMRDITVGAYVDSNNVSLMRFTVNKETTRTPAEIAFAMSHFKRRFAKVGARFDLLSDSYIPKPPPGTPPGKHPPVDPKFGNIKAATLDVCTDIEISAGTDGGYDCSGGSSGGSAGGYDIETPPWPIGEDGDTSDTTIIPTYPPGDNGDRDPCLSPSGEPICQRGGRAKEKTRLTHGEIANLSGVSSAGRTFPRFNFPQLVQLVSPPLHHFAARRQV